VGSGRGGFSEFGEKVEGGESVARFRNIIV